jgi:hypothetical protein
MLYIAPAALDIIVPQITHIRLMRMWSEINIDLEAPTAPRPPEILRIITVHDAAARGVRAWRPRLYAVPCDGPFPYVVSSEAG